MFFDKGKKKLRGLLTALLISGSVLNSNGAAQAKQIPHDFLFDSLNLEYEIDNQTKIKLVTSFISGELCDELEDLKVKLLAKEILDSVINLCRDSKDFRKILLEETELKNIRENDKKLISEEINFDRYLRILGLLKMFESGKFSGIITEKDIEVFKNEFYFKYIGFNKIRVSEDEINQIAQRALEIVKEFQKDGNLSEESFKKLQPIAQFALGGPSLKEVEKYFFWKGVNSDIKNGLNEGKEFIKSNLLSLLLSIQLFLLFCIFINAKIKRLRRI